MARMDMDQMKKFGDNDKGKKGTHGCGFLFSIAYTAVFAYMYFSNPDKVNAPNGCCAVRTLTTVPGFKRPIEARYVPCQSAVKIQSASANKEAEEAPPTYTNVSDQFQLFFLVMFILYLVTIISFLLSTIGGFAKACAPLAKLGGYVSGLAGGAKFVIYIMGARWRWADTGRLCSGEFAVKPATQNLLLAGGYAIKVVLIIWIVFMSLFCACCCIGCICMCMCGAMMSKKMEGAEEAKAD